MQGATAGDPAEQSGEISALHLHGVGPAASQPSDLPSVPGLGEELLCRGIHPCGPRQGTVRE